MAEGLIELAEERQADLEACARMLADATYQLGIVAGRLDEMGVRAGMRHILAGHGQITKAIVALRARAAQEMGR